MADLTQETWNSLLAKQTLKQEVRDAAQADLDRISAQVEGLILGYLHVHSRLLKSWATAEHHMGDDLRPDRGYHSYPFHWQLLPAGEPADNTAGYGETYLDPDTYPFDRIVVTWDQPFRNETDTYQISFPFEHLIHPEGWETAITEDFGRRLAQAQQQEQQSAIDADAMRRARYEELKAEFEPEVDDGRQSGFFCSHWADPSDCSEVCKGCGHPCRDHVESACDICDCNEFHDRAQLCVRHGDGR